MAFLQSTKTLQDSGIENGTDITMVRVQWPYNGKYELSNAESSQKTQIQILRNRAKMSIRGEVLESEIMWDPANPRKCSFWNLQFPREFSFSFFSLEFAGESGS